MTGPIEEGAKLLRPVRSCWRSGPPRFKDPLAGLYLVLVSGATTGAVEGVEWEARAHHAWFHLQLALVRPAAELPHVFVTGFAGAVIWLAAWRRGRAMTVAGAVGVRHRRRPPLAARRVHHPLRREPAAGTLVDRPDRRARPSARA